jgi:hypothetical protein
MIPPVRTWNIRVWSDDGKIVTKGIRSPRLLYDTLSYVRCQVFFYFKKSLDAISLSWYSLHRMRARIIFLGIVFAALWVWLA